VVRRLVYALLVVGSAGCCKKSDIPSLIQRLGSTQAKERNDAALSLARCGDNAEAAVPRLSVLIYDENTGVQSAAAYALRKIGTPSALKVMAEVDASRK